MPKRTQPTLLSTYAYVKQCWTLPDGTVRWGVRRVTLAGAFDDAGRPRAVDLTRRRAFPPAIDTEERLLALAESSMRALGASVAAIAGHGCEKAQGLSQAGRRLAGAEDCPLPEDGDPDEPESDDVVTLLGPGGESLRPTRAPIDLDDEADSATPAFLEEVASSQLLPSLCDEATPALQLVTSAKPPTTQDAGTRPVIEAARRMSAG